MNSVAPPGHQLLGLFDSPYVRRVAITLTHYQIPFTHRSLSVFRHMDAMRPINPLFKVPMLTLPDGEVLYESAYQLDYLDELARLAGKQALTPAQGSPRRAVLQAVALAAVAIEKAVALAYEARRPVERVWPEWVERLQEQMNTALGLLEARCQQPWLVGGALSQADVTLAVGVGFIRHVLPGEWTPGRYPALCAHAARLEALPAFLAVPIDKE